MKKSFADIMAGMQDGLQKKIASKIPSWKGLEVPSALAYEQCSSERTAAYKLRFVPQDAVVADLTGGLGVDSSAFRTKASKLYYYEQNPDLFAAVQRNFALVPGAPVQCINTVVDNSTALEDCDLIYMDPARRSSTGRKVFLLEDCTPNVLELLPNIAAHSPRLLLKLSPMADISLMVRRLQERIRDLELGFGIAEIHVVELNSEVKELLFLLQKDYCGTMEITATDMESSFTFTPETEAAAQAIVQSPAAGQYLFVPSGALMKAGAYNCLGLPRLSQHSHLYLCKQPLHAADGPFGRYYRIEEIRQFGSAEIKAMAGKYAKADVSCHDLPLRSEELSKRLKCKSGGDVHIFASSSADGNIMLICSKLQSYER